MAALKIKDVIEPLSVFGNLFDMVRVIDPTQNIVIHSNLPEGDNVEYICYDFWKKGKLCENCVAGRALVENDAVIKIECQDNQLFMIIASPISLGDKTYVVEMIKDITNNNIMEGLNKQYVEESNKLITDLTKKIDIDYLTGLYNRKYINERLPVDILEMTMNNQRLSVLMLDLDLFKEVNDTYGHLAGDFALQIVSKIMKDNIKRDTDWVARYGGEEFLILLRDTCQTTAYKIAEDIRKAIEKEVIKYDKYTFGITISIGTYTLEPGVNSFNEIIDKVDRNLYRAKKQGRNKVISS